MRSLFSLSFLFTSTMRSLFSLSGLILLLISLTSTRAEQSSIRLLGLGAYITNVGSIKLIEATFMVEFLIYSFMHNDSFESAADARKFVLPNGDCDFGFEDSTRLAESEKFFNFVNLASTGSKLTPVVDQNGVQSHLRVQGTMIFENSLKDWPFDSQTLDIVIETAVGNVNGGVSTVLCNLPSFAWVSPLIRFPGISGRNLALRLKASESTSCWSPFGNMNKVLTDCDFTANSTNNLASRLKYEINYTKPVLESLIKTIFPPLFILLITTSSYFFPLKDHVARLGVCGAGLTGAVLFHVALAAQLPPNNQFTKADSLMFAVYFCNICCLGFSVLAILTYTANNAHLDSKHFKSIEGWYARLRWIGPLTSYAVGALSLLIDSELWFVKEVLAVGLFSMFGLTRRWRRIEKVADVGIVAV